MESFGIALLRAQHLTDAALFLAVAMQQVANPHGVVEVSDAELTTAVNRLANGRSFQKATIIKAREELLSAGVIPEANRVRPIDTGASAAGISRDEAEHRYRDRLHDSGQHAAPAEEFSDLHARLYGILKAVHMAPAMMKVVHEPLRDDAGDVVLVEGRRELVNRLTWDYAAASKLLKEYSIEYVIDACFKVWRVVKRDRKPPPVLDANDPDIKKTLSRFRSYLMGVLGGSVESGHTTELRIQ